MKGDIQITKEEFFCFVTTRTNDLDILWSVPPNWHFDIVTDDRPHSLFSNHVKLLRWHFFFTTRLLSHKFFSYKLGSLSEKFDDRPQCLYMRLKGSKKCSCTCEGECACASLFLCVGQFGHWECVCVNACIGVHVCFFVLFFFPCVSGCVFMHL